jgi:uncharacterized protein YecT (DUF1311 family)
MLSALAGSVATAALVAAGFLLRRWFTGAGTQEKATLYTSLANLHATMKEHGFSLDEVRSLEALLRSKVRQTRSVVPDPMPPEPKRFWTQTAMNMRAYASAKTADAQLQQALTDLLLLLSPEEEKVLDQLNSAWSEYRDKQSKFAAAQYTGGSIMPLIRSSEYENVTLQRLKTVLADVEERKSR